MTTPRLYAIWDTEKGEWWDHRVYFRRCDAANHWNAVNERRRYHPAGGFSPGRYSEQGRYVTREVTLQPAANDA